MNKIETGKITPTHDYVDGKQVYVKRFNFGTLPNKAEKSLEMGFSVTNTTILKMQGCTTNTSGLTLPLPTPSSGSAPIIMYAHNTKICLSTTSDRSNYTKTFVDIYFTYN